MSRIPCDSSLSGRGTMFGIAAALISASLLFLGNGASLDAFATTSSATSTHGSLQDEAKSFAAFKEAYRVLVHPRCLNCHPDGDRPLQGEDSHVHAQNVKRGKDGKGKYAMKCAACHQEKNVDGPHMPPGNPNWHLPAADMPLVFQNRTPEQLAAQLKDPQQNGNKTLEALLHHVSEDSLVLGAWDPGEGRTKPPLTHAEFVTAMRTWIENGAATR